jgi:Variant SH3 domain
VPHYRSKLLPKIEATAIEHRKEDMGTRDVWTTQSYPRTSTLTSRMSTSSIVYLSRESTSSTYEEPVATTVQSGSTGVAYSSTPTVNADAIMTRTAIAVPAVLVSLGFILLVGLLLCSRLMWAAHKTKEADDKKSRLAESTSPRRSWCTVDSLKSLKSLPDKDLAHQDARSSSFDSLLGDMRPLYKTSYNLVGQGNLLGLYPDAPRRPSRTNSWQPSKLSVFADNSSTSAIKRLSNVLDFTVVKDCLLDNGEDPTRSRGHNKNAKMKEKHKSLLLAELMTKKIPYITPEMRAIESYTAQYDDELNIQTGQLVVLLKVYEDGWALVKNDNGGEGKVPKSFLRSVGLSASERKDLF